jgi:nucleotide-binding universal stress UspA family protein
MSIKTILALAEGSDSDLALLASAVVMARHLGAHLDVLHVKADPADLIPVVTEETPGLVVAGLIEAVTAAIGKRQAAAHGAYDRACAGSDVPVSWHELVGREPVALPIAGRFADLLAIARPGKGWEYSLPETADSALFESGRPVVILPGMDVKIAGGRILIAWNGSAQAARATTASIPLLRLASQVDIVTIGDVVRQAPASDLVSYLTRHGITATAHSWQSSKRSIGYALNEAVRRLESNLLVMGAYGHSRMRERILGGATREILTSASLPVFMMH